MKKTMILITFILFHTGLFAQNWKADKVHSHLTFTITHLAVSDVDGKFKEFNATITAEKSDFSDAIFDFTANASSVNTDDDQRDGHLKSPEFFDVAKYPNISFKSTATKKTGNNKFQVKGNLTLHGVTRPAAFDLVYRGTVINPMTKTLTAGFVATGIIKRSDFAFGSKYGTPMLGDEVTFKASGEFSKVK